MLSFSLAQPVLTVAGIKLRDKEAHRKYSLFWLIVEDTFLPWHRRLGVRSRKPADHRASTARKQRK